MSVIDFPIIISLVSVTDPDNCMWLIDGQLPDFIFTAPYEQLVTCQFEKKKKQNPIFVQTFFSLNVRRQISGISELHGTD